MNRAATSTGVGDGDGLAVGLALAGWRPIAEMQFDAFSYPALEQIISHVAKYRERTRGRRSLPIVIRIPSFGGIRGKEHHGESPETYYVHTAGLKVVTPSTPADAYTLLSRAIADPDSHVLDRDLGFSLLGTGALAILYAAADPHGSGENLEDAVRDRITRPD